MRLVDTSVWIEWLTGSPQLSGVLFVPKATDSKHSSPVSHKRAPAGRGIVIDVSSSAFNATETSRLPGPNGRLMHASIRIGDSTVMLVDEMPEHGALGPKSLKHSLCRRLSVSFSC